MSKQVSDELDALRAEKTKNRCNDCYYREDAQCYVGVRSVNMIEAGRQWEYDTPGCKEWLE